MVGKARALACSCVRTCAGVSAGWAENISPAVAATKGDEKLVPTEALKLSVQPEPDGPCSPLLVAARMGNRQGEPAVMLMQLPPGAAMVICVPRSEKPTLVPAWRSASTAITPLQLPGVPTGPPALLPAAATMTTPRARISLTTVW